MDIQLHGRLRGLAVEADYLYPPLFRDLSVYVPRMNVELLKKTEGFPMNHVVQLLYVMNPIYVSCNIYPPQRHRRGAE
jgi:hypothetical protein